MALAALRVAALTLAALSLGSSWAHLLELRPRLLWPPELWIAATVRGGLYDEFGRLGAVVDVAAVAALAALSLADRAGEGRRRRAMAASLYLVALLAWFALVAPMNAVLADWGADLAPGAVPVDFLDVSRRWEFGHVAVALIKLLGFLILAASIPTRPARRPAA